MITTDELFAEDFTPEWMTRKDRLHKQSFTHAMNASIDLQYKLAAQEVLQRISDKHPPRLALPKKIEPQNR